jgi:drug/metabolite transporter (DMT)-like permease
MNAPESYAPSLRARLAQRQVRGWMLLIGANIIFAGAYVAGKFALTTMTPVTLNAVRFTLASVVLAPIVIRERRHLRMQRADLLTFIAVSFLSFVLNKYFEYQGVQLSTASDSALLISGEGVLTALLAWIVLRERARVAQVLALALGFFGAYLIVERGFLPQLAGGKGGQRILGDGLFVLGLFFEAIASIISKRLAGRFAPLVVSSATIVGSLAVWLPVGAWDISQHGFVLTPLAAGGVIYQALFVTAIGYFCWFGGLQLVTGSAAAASLFIQPLVGTLLAVVLLGERLSLFTLVGGACIVASVWTISRAPTSPSPVLTPPLPPE